MLKTYAIEIKSVIRSTVESSKLLKNKNGSLTLKTSAKREMKKYLSSADSDMLTQYKRGLADSDIAEGRVQIDVIKPDVLRVRYAEGKSIPENITPMIVGSVTPLARGSWKTLKNDSLQFRTSKAIISVSTNPFRIEITSPQKKLICGIGGKEKDYFRNWDSYNTGLCTTTDGSPIAVESFDLGSHEAIYGFGEKFTRLNKVGQRVDLYTSDALGVTTPRSYKNVPFFVSTRGYGVYFNHSSIMSFWVGNMSATDIQVAANDSFLDYFIFLGDIKEVLAKYTDLTGKATLPPKWSFGYWQSKISYKAADETLDIARQLRKNKVPCDVIHLDTHWFERDWYCNLEFDKERFPDPKAYIAELAKLGINLSLWQLPYIPEGSDLFNRFVAVDGFVKTATGEIYDIKICFTKGFTGRVGVIDFTNPKAVKVYQDALRELFKMGAKVIKTDFGEGAPLDGVYFDGTPGSQMHNLYPLLYNRAAAEVTKEITGDAIVWARSAWAGSQRYPLHWGGDNSPNFNNLVPQMEGGLSLGLSGFAFWSQDIGGFFGETYDHLLIRWMQMSVFCSHARIHGFGDRELYKFKPETLRICRDFLKLRYRLLPYIYGAAKESTETALPMLRALVIDFQDDPNVWNISDEFLFGRDLLVAPIVDASSERSVYLPHGKWTDWWTGKTIAGGQWIEAKAAIDRIPLYIREGAIVPLGPDLNYVNEVPTTSIELRVTPFTKPEKRTFHISANNKWIPVRYSFNGKKHDFSIGKTSVKIRIKKMGE